MNRKILLLIIFLLAIAGLLFTEQGKSIIDRFRSYHQLTIHLKDSQKENVSSAEVGVFKTSESVNETIESKETDENGKVTFTLPEGRYYIWVANPLEPAKRETIFFPGDGEGVSLLYNREIEVVTSP